MLLNTTPRVGLNVNPVDHMTQHCPCKTAHVTRLVPPTHLLLGVLRPQTMSLPAIMKGGNYLLASHTGSGKTLGYLLPIVSVRPSKAHAECVLSVAAGTSLGMCVDLLARLNL